MPWLTALVKKSIALRSNGIWLLAMNLELYDSGWAEDGGEGTRDASSVKQVKAVGFHWNNPRMSTLLVRGHQERQNSHSHSPDGVTLSSHRDKAGSALIVSGRPPSASGAHLAADTGRCFLWQAKDFVPSLPEQVEQWDGSGALCMQWSRTHPEYGKEISKQTKHPT